MTLAAMVLLPSPKARAWAKVKLAKHLFEHRIAPWLLIVEAERAGFRQMIAVIAGAQPASVRLHAACGFEEAGRMRSVGRKHGQWLDTYYMQRALGQGDSTPPDKEPE